MTLTAERARELLAYDPKNGLLSWKVRLGSRAPFGGLVTSVCKASGYINVRLDKRLYRAHRVIWLMQTGSWPSLQIDHVNRNRSDNRWCNLRESCDALNRQNVEKARRDSTTGLKGVHTDARRPGRFSASIRINGVHHWLGMFESTAKAHAAYMVARISDLAQQAR